MTKSTAYRNSLFIFSRDLRLEDNTGLIHALKNSDKVIPCFIINNRIMSNLENSSHRKEFFYELLVDLDKQLIRHKSRLNIFKGETEFIVKQIITGYKIDAIFLNGDYSKLAQNREKIIEKICIKNKLVFNRYSDFLLHEPDEIETNEGKPYTTYSHFFKKAKTFPVRKVVKNRYINYHSGKSKNDALGEGIKQTKKFTIGRKVSLGILKNIHLFEGYQKERDYPYLDMTTKLSAHIRFGTVSIREAYHTIKTTLGEEHPLIGELYWREFFTYILHHFPESRVKSFRKKFENIKWSQNEQNYEKWCKGKTGFPIIDAGMRQLNKTGFMHNRVRMIVASFLTKDLHISWKRGERYFAKKLLDYDPAVNAGNWQWAASTGCDAVPYFRIFNPWIQQEKYDHECKYIKKWIPELKSIQPKTIHNFWKNHPEKTTYPKPIIDHKIESLKAKEIFKMQQ